jgi:uncharacterized protein
MRMSTILPSRPRVDRRRAQSTFAVTALTIALLAACGWAQNTVKSNPSHDSSLDVRDGQGLTRLISGASAGNIEAIQSLLAQGASVDATAADGRTALIAAVQSGKIEVVRALIVAGANLNRSARGTGTALNVAENTSQTQIAALLLAAGAHSTGKSTGDTVCVRPWSGDGFCGTVKSFSIRSVKIQVTKIVGCTDGCPAKEECSASLEVGGNRGVQTGDQIAVPSWCLTQTGLKQ